MSNHSPFPASARAAWLRRKAKKCNGEVHHLPTEALERRILARELAMDLREATLDQLVEVARVLGRPARWLEMARLEARKPGMVGKACLRAIR
jgi:hypothetical protein